MVKTILLLLSAWILIEDEPQYVLDAIKISAEYKVEIHVMNDPKAWPSAVTEVHNNRIIFNKGHGYWNGYQKNQITEFNIHHYSTPNPNHVAIHEIGHIVLGRKLGVDRFNEVQCRFFPLPLEYVKKEVSNYAVRDMTEFYSEVFAGIWDKKTYPKDIMDLYHSIEEGREN